MFNFRNLKQSKCIPNNFIYTVSISVCRYVACMYIQIAYLYNCSFNEHMLLNAIIHPVIQKLLRQQGMQKMFRHHFDGTFSAVNIHLLFSGCALCLMIMLSNGQSTRQGPYPSSGFDWLWQVTQHLCLNLTFYKIKCILPHIGVWFNSRL